jgi:hypothetical protein
VVNSNTVSLVVNALNVMFTLTIESSAAGNAPISGASIVWTNASTGATYSGTSNSSGVSAITLPGGAEVDYDVAVTASGYASWNNNGQTVSAGTSFSATVLLTPTVTVPTLTVSPTTIAQGGTLAWTMMGFTPNAAVASLVINLPNAKLSLTPLPTLNAEGEASGSFVVGTNVPVGNVSLTATDSAGLAATAPFTVT